MKKTKAMYDICGKLTTTKLSAGYWDSQMIKSPKAIHEEAEKERWITRLKAMIKKHPDTKYLTDFLKKFLKDLQK